MKNLCTLLSSLAVAFLLASSPAFAQQGGGRPGGEPNKAQSTDCDMKVIEKGKWCAKCDKLLEKDDVDKDGKCKTCSEKVKDVDVCVKKHYCCGCDKGGCCSDDKPAPGKCKCGKALAEKTDKARIWFKCSGCGANGPTQGEVKHNDGCKKKDVKRCCSKSGMAPHAPAPK